MTLLEVLVALAILAMALGALYPALGRGLDARQRADHLFSDENNDKAKQHHQGQ